MNTPGHVTDLLMPELLFKLRGNRERGTDTPRGDLLHHPVCECHAGSCATQRIRPLFASFAGAMPHTAPDC